MVFRFCYIIRVFALRPQDSVLVEAIVGQIFFVVFIVLYLRPQPSNNPGRGFYFVSGGFGYMHGGFGYMHGGTFFRRFVHGGSLFSGGFGYMHGGT